MKAQIRPGFLSSRKAAGAPDTPEVGNMGKFEAQAAIVTGGAQGIGGATARRLAREGAKVLIADINEDAAKENAGRIGDEGGVSVVHRADVSKHDDIRGMVEAAVSEFGRMDILVQNAFGTASRDTPVWGSAVSVQEHGWDSGMDLLVKALYLGAKYAAPEMRKTGGGSIINMASVHGLLQAPGSLVYETGKSAVIGMTKQMAIDFGPSGIRVNAICPGHIVTEGLAEMWKSNPGGLKFFEQQYP
ncbi:MAG: SDR family NAD(P)-dependent oxidoreductase, partial [Chloroflexota bacterium]